MKNIWSFENEKQEKQMNESVTPENCHHKLKLIREISGLSRKDLASILGVSESTITRIERKKTVPTQDFMLRLAGLVAIGHAKYSTLSDDEKASLAEYLGIGGGATAGVGGAIGAVATAGSIAGLSATGITSGLAAIGGSMLGGLAVVASIPVAAGIAGFGLVKGIKAICKANNLSCKEVDGRYEIIPEANVESEENVN